MGRRVSILLAASAGMVLGVPTAGAQPAPTARVTLSVSQPRVLVGESIRLDIRAEVEGAPVQSITPPRVEPFEVVRRRQHQPRQFSFSFGGRVQQFQSTIVDTFILRATRVGSFVLGPATVETGGRSFDSNQVTVVVTAGPGGLVQLPGADPTGGATALPVDPRLDDPVPNFDPRAFLRTVVSATEVRVGEQVTVELLLYTADRLRANPSILREATADGFWIQDLVDRRTLTEGERITVNGRTFYVYVLRRLAAFPLRVGTATIGAAEVRVPVTTRRFRIGSAEPLERASVPVDIDVAPLPTGGRPRSLSAVDDADVAVGRFSIKGRLDRRRVETGEAVTVALTVEGEGNVKTVRLELTPDPGDGLEVLPPEVEDEVAIRSDAVFGRRTHRWLVVPSRPGSFTLPRVRLPVWEPGTNRWRLLEGPALSFVATGAALAPDPAAGDDDEPPDPTPTDGVEEDDRARFGPLRTASALTRRPTILSAHPAYPLAVAAPLLAFAGWLGLIGWRRRRTARRASRDPRQVFGDARRRVTRLAAADDDGAGLARLVESTLGTVLDEPVGGYTRRELGHRLVELGLPEAVSRRVVAELERLDQSRFGMLSSSAEDDGAATRVRRLLDELERAMTRGAPSGGPGRTG